MKKSEDYEAICAVCEHACELFDHNTMLCSKKGVVPKTFTCRKFAYDPLKRVPRKSISAPKLEYIDINGD